MDKARRGWLDHIVLLLGAVAVFYPLAIMVMSAMKTESELMTDPLGLPRSLGIDNFRLAWEQAHFESYFANSLSVTAAATLLLVLAASLTAFVLARYEFVGNRWITLLYLAGLVLPLRMGIVPLFVLIRDIGLMDTRLGLILVYAAGGLPFSVFLMLNFFQAVPRDIEDAAVIDGCGPFRLYARIMVPLVRPGLASVAIYQLVGIWNDFFFPLLFIRQAELRTIPLGIARFFGEYETQWNLLFAGLTLAIVPTIVVFLAFSRQFIRGLTTGAIR